VPSRDGHTMTANTRTRIA